MTALSSTQSKMQNIETTATKDVSVGACTQCYFTATTYPYVDLDVRGFVVIMSAVGIFSGKRNTHNKEILTALLSKGPLTTLQITKQKQIASVNKQNLQATIKNRLNALERKDYIYHENGKWLLRCKGIVTLLLAKPNIDAWSPIWSDIFHKSIVIVNDSTTLLGVKPEETEKTMHDVGLCLDELNTWKGFAKITTSLIEKGAINFDEIADKDLLSLLLMEALSIEDVAGLFLFQRL
jgi:hypothetical protein